MSEVRVRVETLIQLHLTKRQIALVTKGLCGALRPEELGEAGDLGLAIVTEVRDQFAIKAEAADHALVKARESVVLPIESKRYPP